MNDLTIVLPLKDRAYFTYRWMKYAEENYADYKIIIADGGKDENVKKCLSSLNNFKKVNYKYIKYRYDSDYKTYFSKLSDAINKVDTEYCILADDDDFITKAGIDQSISFLKTNKDYSCCRGLIGRFSINSDKNIDNIHIGYGQISLSHKDPLSRLTKAFSINHQCLPSYYDVHRTKNINKNFRHLDKMKTNELLMIEMLTNSLDSIDGKIARIDNLFLMRQSNYNESFNVEFVTKYGDVLERIINRNYIEDYNKMKKVIYKEILIKMGLNNDNTIKNKIEIISKLLLEELINDRKKKQLINTRTKYKNNFDIKKYIKNLLPNYIKRKITLELKKRRMSKIYSQHPELIELNNFILNYK